MILDKLAYIINNGKSKQERKRAHTLLLTNDGISSLKYKSGRGRKLLLNSKEHKKIVEKNIELFAH